MASNKAVGQALAILATNFSGQVTSEKVKLWIGALKDVEDEALNNAVGHVIRTHTGDFLPSVAVIREAAGANHQEPVDIERTIRLIERMGSYNPVTGWSPPRVGDVKEHIGGAIAEAYAWVGSRLFSPNTTTREIAERDFAKALTEATDDGVPLRLAQGTKQLHG